VVGFDTSTQLKPFSVCLRRMMDMLSSISSHND
jgi:hypothetical protein